MIAAGVFVDHRCPAEFAPDHDRDIFVEPARVQIGDEGADSLIKHGHVLAAGFERFAVPIPAAKCERDAADAGFDQPPRHEHLLHQLWSAVIAVIRIAAAVAFDRGGIFFTDVERFGQAAACKNTECLLIEAIHAIHHPAGVDIAAKAIEASQ
jgi:hypothetical protein